MIFKLPNQTDGSIFSPASLERVECMKANNNDVWLLDVKQIHSVEGTQPNQARIAICFQSNQISYDFFSNIKINEI